MTLVNITKDRFDPNITITHSQCVTRCSDFPGYHEVANRCFKLSNGTDSDSTPDFQGALLQQLSEDLFHSWSPILISCVVALIFSYILLVLFRYAIKYVVWFIYIGLIAVFVAGAIAFIVFYFQARGDPNTTPEAFLVVAGILILAAVVLGVLVFLFRKRIRLVIQLFKEASKALGDVPLLVAEPLLTFVAMALSTAAFLYFAIVIETSGKLEVQNDADGKFFKATYVQDFGCTAAYYVNLVAFIWFTQFILGCQHFVIAGTVCQWFFARTKSKLDSPIKRSFHYLLRLHIGSVCLGSIFITIVKIIKMLVENAAVRREPTKYTP